MKRFVVMLVAMYGLGQAGCGWCNNGYRPYYCDPCRPAYATPTYTTPAYTTPSYTYCPPGCVPATTTNPCPPGTVPATTSPPVTTVVPSAR